MNVDTYRSLLVELAGELDPADPSLLFDEGRLFVDGTAVALACERDGQGDHLWICVDFGAVPERHARRVYRAMLEANLKAGGPEAGVLTLQASGHAELGVRYPLVPSLDGALLAQVLWRYAALAKTWIADVCNTPDDKDAP